MAVSSVKPRRATPSDPPGVGRLSRSVYVWEAPVRIAHWTIAGCIVVLSLTGYYLHHPFFGPPAGADVTNDGFLLATIRMSHVIAGFVLLAALLARLYWAFVGNRYAHWRAYLPLTPRQRADLRATFAYYTFRRRRFPAVTGHNPLAGLAYVALYLGLAASVATGLGLFAWESGIAPWTTLFGWTWDVLGIQWQRLIHFLLMFWFIAFFVHHVYSAILCDLEERNAEITGMITGWKVDADVDRVEGVGAARGEPGLESVKERGAKR